MAPHKQITCRALPCSKSKTKNSNLLLYRKQNAVGLNLPILSLKDVKYKHNMIIPTLRGPIVLDAPNPVELNDVHLCQIITGKLKLDKTPERFQWNHFAWDNVRVVDGKMKVMCHNELEVGDHYTQYVRTLKNKCVSLVGSKIDVPCKVMSMRMRNVSRYEVSSVRDGYMHLLPGLYIKCKNCACLTHLRNYMEPADVGKPLDAKTITAQLEKLVKSDWDNMPEVVEGVSYEVLNMFYMYSGMDMTCYNCGKGFLSTKLHDICEPFPVSFIKNFGINGTNLNELEKTLHFDTPPPDNFFSARQEIQRQVNRTIAQRLKWSDKKFVTSVYPTLKAINDRTYLDSSDVVFGNARVMATQPLYEHEVMEIDSVLRCASIAGGNLNYTPLSINSWYALHKLVNCSASTAWFEESCFCLPTSVAHDAISLIPCINEDSIHMSINTGNPLLVYDVNSNSCKLGYDDNIALPVTGSNKPVLLSYSANHAISNSCSIRLNGQIYNILTVHSNSHFQVVQFEVCKESVPRMIVNPGSIEVKLPQVDIHSFMNSAGIFTTKWEYAKINIDFLQRLMINLLGAKRTTGSVLRYVAGLAATKYVVGTKEVELTKINLQPGVPELILALHLLCDKYKRLQWVKLHYARETGHSNVSNWIYSGLQELFMSYVSTHFSVPYEKLRSIVNNNFEISMRKDIYNLNLVTEVDISKLLPFKIVDSVSNMRHATQLFNCAHHVSNSCTHEGGMACRCCGQPCEGQFCGCCIQLPKSKACSHTGVQKFCETKLKNNSCGHLLTCPCCELYVCSWPCNMCYSEEDVIVTRGSVTKVSARSKLNTPKPVQVKAIKETRIEKPMMITGRKYNKLTVEGETTVLTNAVNKMSAKDLLVCIQDEMYMPYNPILGKRDVEIAELSKLNIVDRIQVFEYCAYECIARQSNITTTQLIDDYGNLPETSKVELEEIASLFALNLLIIHGTVMSVIRYGSMQQRYIVLCHNSALSEDAGHWCIVSAIEITKADGYWSNKDICLEISALADSGYNIIGVDDKNASLVINKVKILLENETNLSEFKRLTELRVTTIGTVSYLMNNENDNYLRKGKVKIKLPNEVVHLCNAMVHHELMSIELSLATSNVTADMEMYDKVINSIIDVIKQIDSYLKLVRNEQMEISHEYVCVSNEGVMQIPVTGGAKKALDIVTVLTLSNERSNKTVYKTKNMLFVLGLTDGEYNVITYKISLGSLVRRLSALCNAVKNIDNFKKIKFTKPLIGAGGTGKSYITRNSDLTNTTVTSLLLSAIKQYDTCDTFASKTFEQLCMDGVHSDRLHIEEASMITDVDLCCVATHSNITVSSSGDPDQIGVVDFSSTPGLRSPVTVIDMAAQIANGVVRLTNNYRIGNPMCSEVLSKFYPNMQTVASHETTYETSYVPNVEEATRRAILANVDSVFCYYDEHAKYCKSTMSHKTNVYKVHANQGMEGRRVALLAISSDKTLSGILKMRNYIVTGLTRAREHMILYTNIEGLDIKNWYDYSVSGAAVSVKSIDIENLRLTGPLQDEEIQHIELLLGSVDNVTSYSVSNGSIEFKCMHNGTELWFRMDPVGTVGMNYSSNFALKMRSNEVKKKLRLMMQQYDKVQEVGLTEHAKGKNITITKFVWSRLTQLADACLLTRQAGVKLYLNYMQHKIGVKIYDGCSLFAGFKFTTTYGTCHLTSGHNEGPDTILNLLNANHRTIWGDEPAIELILMLLKDRKTGIFPCVNDGYLIGRIMERIGTIVKWGINNVQGNDVFNTNHRNHNVALTERLFMEHGIQQEPIVHQPVHMLLYVENHNVKTFPHGFIIRSINDVMHRNTGITGTDTELADMSATNTRIADAILTRKLKQEDAMSLQPVVSDVVYKKLNMLQCDYVNIRNIVHIDRQPLDDTLVSFADAYFLLYAWKVLKIRDIVTVGCKIDTVMDANLPGVYKLRDDMSIFETSNYNRVKIKKLLYYQTLLENDKTNSDIKELIDYIENDKVLRHSKDGCTVLHSLSSAPQTGEICITVDPAAEGFTVYENQIYSIGNASSVVNKHEPSWFTIHRIGPFSLQVCGRVLDVRISESFQSVIGNRVFNIPATGETLSVPGKFYRKLITRAYLEETTIEDMIAYARSLASTQIYTSRGPYTMYQLDQSKLVDYAIVAQCVAYRSRQFINAINEQVTKPQNFAETLQASVFTSMSNLWKSFISNSEIIDSIQSIYEELKKRYGTDNKHIINISTMVHEVEPVISLLVYNKTVKETSEVPHSTDSVTSYLSAQADEPILEDESEDSDENFFDTKSVDNQLELTSVHDETDHNDAVTITKAVHFEDIDSDADNLDVDKDMEEIMNSYLCKHPPNISSPFKSQPKTMAIVYSGSKGDYTPLDAIYEALHKEIDITIITPKDNDRKYTNAKVNYYSEDYKFLTNVVVQNRNIDYAKLLKHVSGVLKASSSMYDVVIGLFFSIEATIVPARLRRIKIIPQLPHDNASKYPEKYAEKLGTLPQILAYKLLSSTENLHKVPITYVRTIPHSMCDDFSWGWALSSKHFEIDHSTNMVIQHLQNINKQAYLVTLGSMEPKEYNKLIREICSEVPTDIPILLVLGNSKPVALKIRDTNIKDEIYLSDDLIVVKHISYIMLREFLCGATHHMGCGTMLASCTWDFESKGMPIAFDQHFNYNWYKKYRKLLYPDIEYHKFVNNVRKFFKLNEVEYQLIEFPSMEQVELSHLYYVSNVSEMHIYTVLNKEIIKNDVKDNCIYHVLSNILLDIENIYSQDAIHGVLSYTPEHAEFLKNLYQEVMMHTNINTLELLLWFVSQLPFPVLVTHLEYSYWSGKSKLEPGIYKSAHLNDDLSHLEYCEVVIDTHYQRNSVRPNWIDFWPSTDSRVRKKCIEDITALLHYDTYKTMQLPGGSEVIDAAKLSFNPLKLLKTMMRKQHPCYLVSKTMVFGGFMLNQPMFPNYTWNVLTQVGWVTCVSLRSAKENVTYLYHGSMTLLFGTIAIRMNKIEIWPQLSKVLHGGRSSITALNQSSRLRAIEMNIPVTTIGVKHAEVLYIYNTWNRPHHIEKEIEVIQTAVSIHILKDEPAPVDNALIKALRKYDPVGRLIVLKGVFHLAIELPSGTSDSAIRGVSMMGFKKFSDGSVYYKSNKLLDWLKLCKQCFTYHEPVIEWVDPHALKNKYDNLQQLLEDINSYDENLFELGDDYLMVRNFGKEWRYLPLKLCEFKLSVSQTQQLLIDGVMLHKTYILTRRGAGAFTPYITGKGIQPGNESIAWSSSERDYKMKENPFALLENAPTAGRNINVNLEAMFPTEQEGIKYAVSTVTWNIELIDDGVCEVIESYEPNNALVEVSGSNVDHIPTAITQDYWENFTQIHEPVIHLAENKHFKVRSRVEPKTIVESNKLINEEYPSYARPSMTRAAYEEMNSVNKRQGSSVQYKSARLDVTVEAELFAKTYFKSDWKNLSRAYSNDPVKLDIGASQEWLRQHSNPKNVMIDINKLISDGFEAEPINKILVHGKVEQTTKMDDPDRISQNVVTRSILASAYSVSAIYSPYFKRLKQRFKNMCNAMTLYVDGMTPKQMSDVLANIDNGYYMVESDLSKQDRQTDTDTINIEFAIYKLLGADPVALELYRHCHRKWKWYGHGISGQWDEMRLSGQPTTAIGNAITNLCVNMRLIQRNKARIKKVLVLGDDNLIIADTQLNVTMHGTETKALYNMVCKVKQNHGVGGFLSMVVHNVGGKLQICPHFKRMRHRYSVNNYTFVGAEATRKELERKTSYLIMLGKIKEAVIQLHSINAKIEVQDWYDVINAIEANAIYDGSSEVIVCDHIQVLLDMIKANSIKRTARLLTNKHT